MTHDEYGAQAVTLPSGERITRQQAWHTLLYWLATKVDGPESEKQTILERWDQYILTCGADGAAERVNDVFNVYFDEEDAPEMQRADAFVATELAFEYREHYLNRHLEDE